MKSLSKASPFDRVKGVHHKKTIMPPFGQKQSDYVKERSRETGTQTQEKGKIRRNPNHEKVIALIVEKQRKNEKIVKSEILRQAGYSDSVVNAPSQVFDKPSFLALRDELLPDSLILNSLREDIELKPQKRARELEIAAKIKGMYQDQHIEKQVFQGFVFLPPRPVPQGTDTVSLPTQQPLELPIMPIQDASLLDSPSLSVSTKEDRVPLQVG